MLSLILVIASCIITGKGEINSDSQDNTCNFSKVHICIFISLFFLSLLTVFRVVPYILTVIVTIIVLLIFDRKTILKIDYSLLLTFVFLFIFIGNLGEIKPISDFLKSIVNGNEVIVGVISSQVFSNVPAAILLSKFTENARELLIGVNLGGLGTLIASMASLISFKFVAKENVKTYYGDTKKFTFVLGDKDEKLNYPDEYFDLVVSRHCGANMAEVFRVLKRGGVFISEDYDENDCLELKQHFGFGQGFENYKNKEKELIKTF